MTRSSIPVLVLAFLAAALAESTAWCQVFDADVLSPRGLYHRTNRPLPAVLALRGGLQVPEDGFQVVLLDADGSVLDTAEGLGVGEMDLTDLMPVILDLEHAARVQVVADGLPVGTPLVIEPLIGRAPIRSVRSVRPDGRTRYTRIIGFGDDLLDPEDDDDRQALERMRASPDWEEGDPRILSGFRTYLDRDIVLETDFGEIRIDLAPESAPNTAWNFRHLAEHGFYDDTVIHRIVHMDAAGRRFVIQTHVFPPGLCPWCELPAASVLPASSLQLPAR